MPGAAAATPCWNSACLIVARVALLGERLQPVLKIALHGGPFRPAGSRTRRSRHGCRPARSGGCAARPRTWRPAVRDSRGAAYIAGVATESHPLDVEDVERKPEKGMLARRINVAAPELPAVKGTAHFHPLLTGVERVQSGGAQDALPSVGPSQRRPGWPDRQSWPQTALQGLRRCAGSGAAMPAHIGASTKSNSASAWCRCQRDKGKPVPAQDRLVVHCSIESGAGRQPKRLGAAGNMNIG